MPAARGSDRAALPTGTVTFLFTDIEGSTRLLERLGQAWPALLQRHHSILRDAIGDHHGSEAGTEGDAFFVAFERAGDAVRAAATAQRAIAGHDWPDDAAVRVRMGIHTGEGQLAGGDYVGIDVHRAARISAVAHGGQVLVSDATRALVETSLDPGLMLRDLGEHRLKDLARPERIYQLVVDGLPADFAPIRSLDLTPNNLPTQLTTFLGRRHELDAIARRLKNARLLTLTGPGGTGKTRLSLQVAAEIADRFPDGVYFVPLAPVSDPRLVAPTILQAMGIHDSGSRPPEERLTEMLAGRRLLLVLDNLEQVLDAAPMVADLLKGAPDLQVLATSRAPLRVYGEQEYPVPPLGLPDPRRLRADSLSQYEAVALFIERAVAVKPDFAVTNDNAPAVAEIVSRLDGLPLAIELAAARTRLLPPKAMLSRLEARLSLLEGGARDLPARQQTLRGAIAWSYDLLDEPARRLLGRLSAFVAGCRLEEAEEVCGPAEELGSDVLSGLAELVDQSLLRQEQAGEEPRFLMLETIRDFALERLTASGEVDLIRDRHAAVFLALAERAEPHLIGADQRPWLDRLEEEHGNLRAALSHLDARGDTERLQRLSAAVWRFWQIRGHLREAREWLTRVLAKEGAVEPHVRSRALEAAGGVAYWQADFDTSRRWYEECLTIERERGDEAHVANALYNLSFTYELEGGDLTVARALVDESLEIYRRLGDEGGISRALWGLANVHFFNREYANARTAFEESLEIAQRRDERFQIGWSLYMRSLADQHLGDIPSAVSGYSEALRLFDAAGDVSGVVLLLTAFRDLATIAGDTPRAARLGGASAALEAMTGTELASQSMLLEGRAPIEPVKDAAPEEWAIGESMTVEQAVAYALAESA